MRGALQARPGDRMAPRSMRGALLVGSGLRKAPRAMRGALVRRGIQARPPSQQHHQTGLTLYLGR